MQLEVEIPRIQPWGTVNKGYYQAEVIEEGLIHSLNYTVSIVPFLILMSWLYYRSGRSVLVAIIFHLIANFGNEIFLTHPDTKVIQTALLLVLSVAVVWLDRKLFLTPPSRRGWSPHSPAATAWQA